MHLDHNHYAEAQETVADGNQTLVVNCPRCQGHGSGRPDSPGYYCSDCKGTGHVRQYAFQRMNRTTIDYWQARALIAEVDGGCWSVLADWLEEQGYAEAAQATRKQFGVKTK